MPLDWLWQRFTTMIRHSMFSRHLIIICEEALRVPMCFSTSSSSSIETFCSVLFDKVVDLFGKVVDRPFCKPVTVLSL